MIVDISFARILLKVASYIVQANNILVKDLPEDIKNIPAIYMYNFAGSVSFDAFVTFEGSNLVQLFNLAMLKHRV